MRFNSHKTDIRRYGNLDHVQRYQDDLVYKHFLGDIRDWRISRYSSLIELVMRRNWETGRSSGPIDWSLWARTALMRITFLGSKIGGLDVDEIVQVHTPSLRFGAISDSKYQCSYEFTGLCHVVWAHGDIILVIWFFLLSWWVAVVQEWCSEMDG